MEPNFCISWHRLLRRTLIRSVHLSAQPIKQSKHILYKTVVIIYLVCFGLYVLFSRQPDYFESDFANASIHFVKDSSSKITSRAFFTLQQKEFTVDVNYLFRNFSENENVKIIYNTTNPAKAALYSIWGYWIRWQEIIFTAIVLFLLFQIAVSINKNPTPEAVIEQLEEPSKKTKYDI